MFLSLKSEEFGATGPETAAPALVGGLPRPANDVRRPRLGGFVQSLIQMLIPPRTRSRHQPALLNGPEERVRAMLPPPPNPSGRRGGIDVFADEAALSMREIAASHAVYQQFCAFVEAVRRTSILHEAERHPEYAKRVSLFAVGALLHMEKLVDFRGHRGRALVHTCLELFVQNHGSMEEFSEALGRYLNDPRASHFVRSGARCYEFYSEARLGELKRVFGETFGVFEPLEKTLGGRVIVGILFTDIVDSVHLTSELGDALVQEMVEDHERQVALLLHRYGGRQVKHLGDGLMLAFARPSSLIGFASALVDAQANLRRQKKLPRYRIRVGGHFGEAIQRESDFFGSTVQKAARIADTAMPGEARFSTEVIDSLKCLDDRFQSVGSTYMRGFPEPVSLSVYQPS